MAGARAVRAHQHAARADAACARYWRSPAVRLRIPFALVPMFRQGWRQHFFSGLWSSSKVRHALPRAASRFRHRGNHITSYVGHLEKFHRSTGRAAGPTSQAPVLQKVCFGQHRHQRRKDATAVHTSVGPVWSPQFALLTAVALEHPGVQGQTVSRTTVRSRSSRRALRCGVLIKFSVMFGTTVFGPVSSSAHRSETPVV